MADQSVNGRMRDDSAEVSESNSERSGNDAVQRYGPWVTFYGFLHDYVAHRTVVFGGSGVVGALVLVRQFYAFASKPTEWSDLPSWTVVFGIVLFAFGVGYYVVRNDTACSECDAPFSKERIGKRPVSKRSGDDGRDRMYVEVSYECRNCGETSSDLYSHPEWSYTRY
jgi:hypothetical protein